MKDIYGNFVLKILEIVKDFWHPLLKSAPCGTLQLTALEEASDALEFFFRGPWGGKLFVGGGGG